MKNQVVILGGGTSSYHISKQLRELGVDLPITILSEEGVLPYNRMLLPRLLKEEIEFEKVFFADNHWYQENNIRFIGGIEILNEGNIIKAFPTNHWVEFEGLNKDRYRTLDQRYFYDDLTSLLNASTTHLIIATGGDAFVPQVFPYSKNVLTWRTLGDTLIIRRILKQSNQVALVGGSFIGMELAMACNHFKVDSDWAIITKGLIRDELDSSIRLKLLECFENSTLKISFETAFENVHEQDIKSQQKIAAMLLGEVKTYDAMLLGTGIQPSLSIPKNFIKTESAYYAGDMVQFEFAGRKVQTGSFNQAVKIAKYIAQDIAGTFSITDQQDQINQDIALTPYQIKFGSTLIRLAGIISNDFKSTVENDGKRITQTWFNEQGEKVGYCVV